MKNEITGQNTVEMLMGLNWQLSNIIQQLESLGRKAIMCKAPEEQVKTLASATKLLYKVDDELHQHCWKVFKSKYQRIDGKEI